MKLPLSFSLRDVSFSFYNKSSLTNLQHKLLIADYKLLFANYSRRIPETLNRHLRMYGLRTQIRNLSFSMALGSHLLLHLSSLADISAHHHTTRRITSRKSQISRAFAYTTPLAISFAASKSRVRDCWFFVNFYVRF